MTPWQERNRCRSMREIDERIEALIIEKRYPLRTRTATPQELADLDARIAAKRARGET